MALGEEGSRGEIIMNNQNLVISLLTLFMLLSIFSLALALVKRNALRKKSSLMKKLFGEFELSNPVMGEKKKKFLDSTFFLKLLGSSYRSKLREKLSKAGQIGDEFLILVAKRKFIYFAIGLVLGALYFASSGGYFKAIFVGVFGFMLPDILLTNTIQKRGEAIEGALPDAVEMLTMCVEAGLTFQQSLGKVSKNQNSVIATEFARVMSEIQIGEARSDALEAMAERLNHPDVKKFVSAMHQVDRLGIPISTVLKEQVKELRGKARDRAREKAQKVPVKILGPVMLCFLPSVLIIVIGPVILQVLSKL